MRSNGIEEGDVFGGAQTRQDDVTGGDDLGGGQAPDVQLVDVFEDWELKDIEKLVLNLTKKY